MKKIKYNYKENILIDKMSDFLVEEIINSGKIDIVIINIGTDKNIGDSVAPLVGTLLQSYDTNLNVFGTLEEPIHALNLDKNLAEINSKFPNAYIIGIDACLGGSDNIGEIHVRDFQYIQGKA